jgi:phage terminase Nu1 subunit (DNA packaging protein)
MARRKTRASTSRKPRSKASRKAPAKAGKTDGLVRRGAAAERFGVEPSRINRWVADGAPVARKGRPGHAALYDLQALERWRRDRKAHAEAGLSLEEERAKLAEAQRQKIELELQVRRGELVEGRQAEQEGKAFVRASMTRLLQVPRHATQVGLISREREPELRRLITEACREMSGWQTLEDLAVGA